MRVVGIYGSPRKGGNSDILLDRILQGAEALGAQVEKVYCRKLKMSGCIECGGCDETGQCVVQDDMQDVYPLLEQAQAVVLSVPIFFYDMPAQAKALVDRCQACWSKRKLSKPREQWGTYDSGKCYLVGVGATKGKNLFLGLELVAKYWCDALDMSYEGGLLLRGIEGKGAVNQHPGALEQADDLAKKIVQGISNPA
jgi:multimeric flavodoxin WrbA